LIISRCCWLLLLAAAAAAPSGGIFEEFLRKILKKNFSARERGAREK